MAEESEKRFEAIMNKLFNAPPKSNPISSNTSRHGVPTLIGRKRPHSSLVRMKLAGDVLGESGSSLSGSATSAQAPLCRPWDRNDLFKRLSTFKSMTWFAKPQVVSPLECARRGWVNVDMDTIACPSCDARLLFSTPSTWGQQQVEKAAMVFSLKLESGHKLLCPWINNACTEELAQFPIVSRADLVDDYKKRFFALSQLMALPVVSPVAINNLGSSQLEQFLGAYSTSGSNVPLEISGIEIPEDVPDSNSSISYYQAQKLISLFGWEPHMLPYKVDFKDKYQSVKDANVTVATGQKQKVSIYSLCTSEGTKGYSGLQFDPNSVVLDCKLCGASVGLWAFCTIPQLLEYLRFVGLTEVNGKTISSHDEVTQEGSSGNWIDTGNREGITNTVTPASASSGFTIAGGPPPAMLNYGATISLPIIGHNLRARIEDEQKSFRSTNVAADETTANPDPDFENPSEVSHTVGEGSILNVNLIESAITVNPAVAESHRLDAAGFSGSTLDDNTPSQVGGGKESDKEEMFEPENYEQGSSCPSNNRDNLGIGLHAKCRPPLFSIREGQKQSSFNKSMEFDPIKQHRHFCPWIMSTGKFTSGWQQTLSALEGQKEFSNVPSCTLIEVDDPVASVKNLFSSPNEKKNQG